MPPKSSNVNIFYQHVQGLKTKLNDLRHNLLTFDPYDIIVLNEIWHLPDILDSELGLNDFQLFRLDRIRNTNPGSRGGGVFIAVKTNLKSTLIKTDVNCIEQIFVQLTLKSVLIAIGTVYILSP